MPILSELITAPSLPQGKASATSISSTDRSILPKEYYEARLSRTSKARKPSPIWDLFPVELQPGMLSMLAGKPNPTTFPFQAISLIARSPEGPNATPLEIVLQGEELVSGLQYGLTSGVPCFNKWVYDFMKTLHSRGDAEGWKVSIGSGSQDILYKAFSALFNPGDTVLIEAPTYPAILPIIQSLQCQVVEIVSDSEGISAMSLSNILEDWDPKIPFPKVLYTVPFGSNPTGRTTSERRRVEILSLARKHDFLIFEDDPYHFIYYGSAPKPASYFELEKKIGGELGRVLRFDSFSKVLAAGFRIGWVTGPSRLVEAINLHDASSTVQPSSIGQILLFKLLETWGISGFLSHTRDIAEFYRRKRDIFEQCLNYHLAGLAEWHKPDASMFFWITLTLPPSFIDHNKQEMVLDSESFIRNVTIKRGVLLLPGNTAYIDDRKTTCVRVSFSLLTEDEMEEAVKRLADAIKEQWDEYYLSIKL
ncbi:hypothetical protein M422DRAFT_780719 [Sphaerobolus stellatus SS14]|uniref:Aminotransferase class I/classII large domain-containing protein n=1 Tax=Sphaerobolus stellatus (strain SS14) TaxID=990650 RepID=A0A0C9V016_SPHS4|nr:hypothetical protein M422DRAFT_780719 [Sphaerobolus stellatus SS14]